MKRLLLWLGLFYLAGVLSAADQGTSASPQRENKDPTLSTQQLKDLRQAIEKALLKAVEIKRTRGQKTEALEKEVRGLLKRGTPPKPAPDPGSATQSLVDELRVPSGSILMMVGIRSGPLGYEFDNSEDGRWAAYEGLKRLSPAEGEAQILRLCRLMAMSIDLKRENESKDWHAQALAAARAWLGKHPENAEAHALLGQALMMGNEDEIAEAIAEVNTALAADPQCALARVLLLERRCLRLMDVLVSDKMPALDAPSLEWGRYLRRLFDQPPSDAQMQNLAGEWEDIVKEKTRMSALPGMDSLLRFRSTSMAMSHGFARAIAEAARKGLAKTPEEFQALANHLQTTTQGEAMLRTDWLPDMKVLCEHEMADGQILIAATMFPVWFPMVTNPPEKDKTRWESLPEASRQLMDYALEKARVLALKDESEAAARACEAVACTELMVAAAGDRPSDPSTVDLLIRAISLDPVRNVALDFLMGMASQSDPALALALGHIRLAMVHTYQSHRQCVAAARHLRDWKTCQTELEGCLKHRKDDLAALSGLIAVRLKDAQTPERLREVEKRFEKAREVYGQTTASHAPEVVEDFVVNYYLYLGLKADWKSAVELMETLRNDGRVSEATATKMLSLAPL